jgi:hypothetical protein
MTHNSAGSGDGDEALFVRAQESVLRGLARSGAGADASGASDAADGGKARKPQQQPFDVMLPSDFSRESIFFIRYAVDCCGVRVFDLAPHEVRKLWLDFCVAFNDGGELTSDWYASTAISEKGTSAAGGGAGGGGRLVRLDATTWPSLDRSTAHDWHLNVPEGQQQLGEVAAKLSSKVAQSDWRSFFVARNAPPAWATGGRGRGFGRGQGDGRY